jgi:hypothetical protein
MDITKKIIELLIGLTALITSIVVMKTKLIELKEKKKTSSAPKNIPAASKEILTIADRSSLWSRMTLFERFVAIFNLFTFAFSSGSLIFFIYAASGPATFREVAFVGLLVSMVTYSSRHLDT